MREAFGIIETYGLIAAVRACDTALKSANVVLESINYIRGGIVSVTFRGDVGAVKACIDSGVSEANRGGIVLGSSVIPRLDEQVEKIVSKDIKNIPVSSYNKSAKANPDVNNNAQKLEEEKKRAELKKADEDRKKIEAKKEADVKRLEEEKRQAELKKQRDNEEKLKFDEEEKKLEELKRKTEELKKAEELRKANEVKKVEPPKPNNNNKNSGGGNNKKKGRR